MVSQETIDNLVRTLDNYQAFHYGDCERCKSGGKTTPGRRVTLCGDFITKFCDSCVREWDVFCDRSEEYKKLVLADYEKMAVKALIKAGQDLRKDLRTAVEVAMKAKTAMYGLAESWVKRTREK